MAYGYRTRKRRFRRRRYRRSRRSRFTSTLIPTTKAVKLRYVESVSQDSSTPGNIVFRRFNLNSLFDPSVSTGGHQPMGFDIWSEFYSEYIVVGAKVTLKINPTTNNSIIGMTLLPSAATMPTDSRVLCEQKYTKFIPVSSQSAPSKFLKYTYSPKRWFGVSNVTDNDELWAKTDENPAESAHIAIWAAPQGPAAVSARIWATITYLAIFRGPKVQGLN